LSKKTVVADSYSKPKLEIPLQRFIRIVELPRKPGDTLIGYQAEVIWIDDADRVVKRKLIDKPNLFEYAYTQAGEYIDPRNESLPE
jgi:hypothetical protein